MKKEYIEFISELFPFKGLSNEEIDAAFRTVRYSIEDFSKNELIFTPEIASKRIGFVISGECTVEKPKCDGSGIPLNTHRRGASFGILSVFNPAAEFPTNIRASKTAQVLFIDGDDMIKLVRTSPEVAMNVIAFLSKKVAFLNNKVSAFSEKTTLGKVAAYLLNEMKKSGETISIARTKMAEAIGIGRASLYRDLDTLENEGIIKQESKKIIIICSEELERKIK